MFQLQQAISSFVYKGHRVLVFGRHHMKSWEAYKHSDHAHTGWFFTHNVLVFNAHICCLFHYRF